MRVEKAFQVSETSRLTCSQMTSGEGHPTDSRFTSRLSLGLWFRRMSQQQSNFLALMNVGGELCTRHTRVRPPVVAQGMCWEEKHRLSG